VSDDNLLGPNWWNEAERADWMGTGGNGHDAAGLPMPGEVRLIAPPVTAIREIPPRPWLYGRFLLLGAAAVIGAQDSAGKGTIAVTTALAIITGKALLGERVWKTGNVAVISYEDDMDEWRRRFAAACLHHGLDYEAILRHVKFVEKLDGRITLASQCKDGLLFPDSARIVDLLKADNTALLIIDPFNSAHNVLDGNSNVAIAAVAQEVTRIAKAARVAVLVLHHLRKGAAGSADDLMGAVALRANFRATRVLIAMTESEAATLGITDGTWRYLRIAAALANYAPPPDKATWFKLESVALGNGTEEYPEGDSIGVARAFEPPAMFEGMSYQELGDVFEALKHQPHSPNPKVQIIPWAGRPLIDLGKRSEAQAKTILKAWQKEGVLIEGAPFKAPKREPISTVTVNPVKTTQIMAGHSWQRPPGHPDDINVGDEGEAERIAAVCARNAARGYDCTVQEVTAEIARKTRTIITKLGLLEQFTAEQLALLERAERHPETISPEGQDIDALATLHNRAVALEKDRSWQNRLPTEAEIEAIKQRLVGGAADGNPQPDNPA
jgi:hypothetical protein